VLLNAALAVFELSSATPSFLIPVSRSERKREKLTKISECPFRDILVMIDVE
jgi:hypothetical protein